MPRRASPTPPCAKTATVCAFWKKNSACPPCQKPPPSARPSKKSARPLPRSQLRPCHGQRRQRSGRGDGLPLGRLHLADVTKLVTAVAPAQPADIARRLYQATDGLPYFVVEYLQALLQNNGMADADDAWALPPTVRDLLHARLSQLHEAERQILQTAVIGHAFSVELAQATSGRCEEEVVTALEMLVARGILLELQAVYDFSHEKLCVLAYEEMGLARRRLPPAANLPAQIATHYRLAGKDEEAAVYFAQAGDQARLLFAHQEALHHYQAALAGYDTAVSLAPATETGAIEHKLAQVSMRPGGVAAGGAVHLGQSLALAARHYLVESQVAALNNLALVETAVGHTADALNHLQEALALCRQFATATGKRRCTTIWPTCIIRWGKRKRRWRR